MKYAFIESDLVGEFPLAVICRVLSVTQAGYHAWLKRPASAMAVARDELAALIKRVFAAFKGKYGAHACTENSFDSTATRAATSVYAC